jgi:hypothetical protein
MIGKKPSFFIRLFLAFGIFFRFIFNGEFAAGVLRLRRGEAPAGEAIEEVKEQAEQKPAPLKEAPPDAALQLLGLLQQEGRFIDFIEEEVASFSDAEIGAAARVVHEGCRKALREHITTEPIHSEQEGTRITVQEGFDASSTRLTGKVVGKPPFSGTLIHRGWRVTKVNLPKVAAGHDINVIAQAEVEL